MIFNLQIKKTNKLLIGNRLGVNLFKLKRILMINRKYMSMNNQLVYLLFGLNGMF